MKISERLLNDALLMEWLIVNHKENVIKFQDQYYSRSSLARRMETTIKAAIKAEADGK